MSRFTLLCAALLLMSTGGSLCVAACSEGCVLVTGSLHKTWSSSANDHIITCRAYAAQQALTAWADPIDGGARTVCKKGSVAPAIMEYRLKCTTCTSSCDPSTAAGDSDVVQAGASSCDNTDTKEMNREICKQEKDPKTHCEDATFPPDHDV